MFCVKKIRTAKIICQLTIHFLFLFSETLSQGALMPIRRSLKSGNNPIESNGFKELSTTFGHVKSNLGKSYGQCLDVVGLAAQIGF